MDLNKVEKDVTLTTEEKEILRGVHKRDSTNGYQQHPSENDLQFLEDLYSEYFNNTLQF